MQENSTGLKYFFLTLFLRLFNIRVIFAFLKNQLISELFQDSPFFLFLMKLERLA